MSKEKKLSATVISLMIAVIIVAVIAGVLIYGMQKPTVKFIENGFQIKSMYGLTVDFSEIEKITLEEKSIENIASGLKRTNGIGNIGKTLKGHFTSENLGNIMLFVYAGSAPTIRIERKDDKDIFINFADSEETTKLYEALQLNLKAKTLGANETSVLRVLQQLI